MNKTIEIRKLISEYKNYKRYKNWLVKNNRQDYISEYKFFEYDRLRELAKLKTENPVIFNFACVLDRLTLN